MNTCQFCHTELTNKRAKNCATCNEILQDANKYEVYGDVLEVLQETGSHEAARGAFIAAKAARGASKEAARAANFAAAREWSLHQMLYTTRKVEGESDNAQITEAEATWITRNAAQETEE